MTDHPDDLASKVGADAERRIALRKAPHRSAWRGLAFFGLVGWTVVVPTIAGAALGMWIDGRNGDERSWTLALMIAGLVLGCATAWGWINSTEDHDE